MNSDQLYDELPCYVKENINFPMNYMYLTRDQQEFVEILVSLTSRVNSSPIKEDLEYIKDELEQLIEKIE